MSQPLLAGSLVLACATVLYKFLSHKKPANLPPIVPIPENDIFQRPREAYEKALREHGHVIGVRKKGRLEFVYDDHLNREVLTSNADFSFGEGAMTLLNMHYLYKYFTEYFFELDDLIRNSIINRMPVIIDQVGPIFMKQASKLMEDTRPHGHASNSAPASRYVNLLDYTHRGISEAMTAAIFGPQFVNERNLLIIEKVACDMAVIGGLYQNGSWWGRKLPFLWRMRNWTRVSLTTLPLFLRVIGLQVWNELQSREFSTEEKECTDGSVLEYLARKNARRGDGKIGVRTFLRMTSLLLGIIFASVHLTASVAVWVMFELARRPEYLPALREELFSLTAIDPSSDSLGASYEALRDAPHLDSFIREVLRTKGDLLSTCRKTTADVSLGGYTIPRGHLVLSLTTLSHLNPKYYGADAAKFDGNRWIDTDKQAITVSPHYLPFGVGRWSCPGRVLAVAEIKMIVWSVICRATPVLKGNSYRIVDPLEITAIPPYGELTLVPCK